MKLKIQILLFLLSTAGIHSFAQTRFTGHVENKHGESIPGVNIYIENSYDGTTSDQSGNFTFTFKADAKSTLVASCMGYKVWKVKIDLFPTNHIQIILNESINSLDAVTITAGTFAASDQQRASVLDPIDIYTTASANGDVMAAMRTMPGTQASPDDGRLLVRGGDASESKTFIDGLLTSKPYFSKTPDVATRGRFSPSMFNGVQFSSGGYSAEYGQALSSVLELNSIDVASSDVFGASIMTIGAEANYTKAFKQSSFSAATGYTNMGLYQAIFNSSLDWIKPVESFNFNANYKYKPNSTGIFKAFINIDSGDLSYRTSEGNGTPFTLSNKSNSSYSNISYKGCFSKNTCFKIGLATTIDANKTNFNTTHINTNENALESRFSVTQFVDDAVTLRGGLSETMNQYEEVLWMNNAAPLFNPKLREHILGSFVESEIKFSKYFAILPGIRSEYSTLLKRWNVAPRFALAAKTGKQSQLSAAWGRYYQTPQFESLKFNPKLNFEDATHYILSYQSGQASKRLFRTELYHKQYNQLVSWEGNNPYSPQRLNNTGKGYARGVDLFWKDKKSIRHFEYWLTYSYIDTKRQYQNYPELAKPDFISDHTFSLVTKYWANKISTQFGSSLTVASPRNYHKPNSDTFMNESTDWYSNLSVNMSHIFYIGDQYSVFYVSLSNVLGNDNVLGYRPSTSADAEGNYSLTPINRNIKRFLFVGLFLSF